MPGAGGEDARLDLKARVFSCGHVIPACNLLAAVACTGPTGKAFDFSFAARRDPAQVIDGLGRAGWRTAGVAGIMFWYPLTQIAELGRLVANVCQTVPAGIVCFFPSYDFEDHVYKVGIAPPGMGKGADALSLLTAAGVEAGRHPGPHRGTQEGVSARVWRPDVDVANPMAGAGQVFREERGGESADSILAVYGAAITAGRGAVLFSVVGGKMSEGINFKDDMGRYAAVGQRTRGAQL